MSTSRTWDVWNLARQEVYKGVPFDVVTDWVGTERLAASDKIKPSAGELWTVIGEHPHFRSYIPVVVSRSNDAAEALEPLEMEFHYPRPPENDDEVDMIPLIDISMVLLIFFMMSSSSSQMSRVDVPETENAPQIDNNPDTISLEMQLEKVGADPKFGINGGRKPFESAKDLDDMMDKLDLRIKDITGAAHVRIAAAGDLSWDVVEKVMKKLDKKRNDGVALEYTVETNPAKGAK